MGREKSSSVWVNWAGLENKSVHGEATDKLHGILQGVPVMAASIRLLVGLGGSEAARELDEEWS